MSVIVYGFTVAEDRYDQRGRLIERKGERVVSHGEDTQTGRVVVLPCEPWGEFTARHCVRRDGEYFLKRMGQ